MRSLSGLRAGQQLKLAREAPQCILHSPQRRPLIAIELRPTRVSYSWRSWNLSFIDRKS